MRQITLPLPKLDDDSTVNIKISTGKNHDKTSYKIVAFIWNDDSEKPENMDETSLSLKRISRLKKKIESYNKAWELIQIFAPSENEKYIRVLYRKKQNKNID